MSTQQAIVKLRDIRFSWRRDLDPVLDIPSFDISRGEHVFLKGSSGSGKTTLLNLIAAVLQPQTGTISINDQPLAELRRSKRDQFRVDNIGLVFQQFNLLPFLTVADNVQLSCKFSRLRRSRACEAGQTIDQETDRLLSAMKLDPNKFRDRQTAELSVGQQQRVAVARALIGRPPLIIADEPTSSLDSESRQAFLDLLFSEIEQTGSTLLFVSHDAALASSFNRRVDLCDINKVSTANDFEAEITSSDTNNAVGLQP